MDVQRVEFLLAVVRDTNTPKRWMMDVKKGCVRNIKAKKLSQFGVIALRVAITNATLTPIFA